jgi:integrase
MRGNGRIFPRKGSSNLWSAYYLRGKEYRESTGTMDRKKAERFLKQRLKEVGADQIGAKPFGGPQQDRLTVDQLLEALEGDYELRGKLTPQFGSHLARIRDYFGAVRATALSSETVDKYISEQLEAGFKPATVNRGTQLLRQGYALAINRRHLHSMPSIRRLDETDNVRRGFFEEPELRRVVGYLPDYLQDFTLYGFLTGWRKGGIKNLRWPDVAKQIIEDKETQERMEVEVVFLPAKYWKNRDPQTMPLVGELAEIIARRRAARAVTTKDGVMLSESIFHRDGKPIGDMRKAWKTACKLAGVSGRLFHDLSRTFARNADNDGVSRSVAKEIMGRKTEAIYARYRIVAQGEKVSALLRMQRKSCASPGRVVPMPSVAVQ